MPTRGNQSQQGPKKEFKKLRKAIDAGALIDRQQAEGAVITNDWSLISLFSQLPAVLHGFGELLRGEGVQDVGLGQPGAARLHDPKAQFFHM
jgi:hypothetical protein